MAQHHFDATVERDGQWWVFDIPELGTAGQARNLAEVRSEAQQLAALWLDTDPDTITITTTITAPESALAEWRAAEQEDTAARTAQQHAATRRRAVIKQLRAEHYNAPDIGQLLGISKQRVYQLEKSA